MAWSNEGAAGAAAPFRIVGGHTDSPNLRVKQHPDLCRAGWQLVGVEPYGGVLLNSWLDRDLGLSGRVTVRADGGTRSQLVLVDRPVLRVPQLAIHLDREVGTSGLKLNPQQHLAAVWGVGDQPGAVRRFLAAELGVEAADVARLGPDDPRPHAEPAWSGRDGDLVSAPRMDNQVTCFAGTTALLQEVGRAPSGTVRVLALFDHEEVGSVSDRGAASPLLETVLERIVAGSRRCPRGPAPGPRRLGRRLRRHGPRHPPQLRREARAAAPDRRQRRAGAQGAPQPALRHRRPGRGGLRAGLRAGRRAAAARTSTAPTCPAARPSARSPRRWLGVTTVDVGAPQLAMHSARELCGAQDPGMYVASLAAFLSPAG